MTTRGAVSWQHLDAGMPALSPCHTQAMTCKCVQEVSQHSSPLAPPSAAAPPCRPAGRRQPCASMQMRWTAVPRPARARAPPAFAASHRPASHNMHVSRAMLLQQHRGTAWKSIRRHVASSRSFVCKRMTQSCKATAPTCCMRSCKDRGLGLCALVLKRVYQSACTACCKFPSLGQ